MPLPTAPWQASLQDLLMGATTVYPFGDQFIDGLGIPKAKSADIDLDLQDGATSGPDFMGPRTLLVHLEVWGTSQADGFNNLRALKSAFFPTTSNTPFNLWLPGDGHVFFNVRPRGLEVIARQAKSARFEAVGELWCPDPHSHDVV